MSREKGTLIVTKKGGAKVKRGRRERDEYTSKV